MHTSFLSTEMARHMVLAYLKVETRKIQVVLRPDERYRSLYPNLNQQCELIIPTSEKQGAIPRSPRSD